MSETGLGWALLLVLLFYAAEVSGVNEKVRRLVTLPAPPAPEPGGMPRAVLDQFLHRWVWFETRAGAQYSGRLNRVGDDVIELGLKDGRTYYTTITAKDIKDVMLMAEWRPLEAMWLSAVEAAADPQSEHHWLH